MKQKTTSVKEVLADIHMALEKLSQKATTLHGIVSPVSKADDRVTKQVVKGIEKAKTHVETAQNFYYDD